MPETNLKFGPMLIENFGPYIGKHVFNWDAGPALYYIAGRNLREPALGGNGAGKTTLLVALFWALYGQTLRNTRPGERVEPWRGKGTTSVRIGFIRNGQKHDLFRSRKPSKLTLDDREVADAEVRRFLPTPDVMLYSFLIAKTNTLFLDLKPEPQSQLFTDLLELDLWIGAAERAGVAAREAGREVEKADLEIASLEGRIGELRDGLKQLEVREHEYEEETNRQLEALDAEIAELRQQAKAADTAVAKLKPETNQELAGLEQLEAEANKAVRAWERKLYEIRADLKTATRENQDYSAQLGQMRTSKKCPTCGTELTDYDSLRKKLEEDAREKINRLNGLRTEEADAAYELEGWSEELKSHQNKLAVVRHQDDARRREHADAERRATTTAAALAGRVHDRRQLYESENPHTVNIRLVAKRLSTLTDEMSELVDLKVNTEAIRDTAKLWQDAFRTIRLSIIEDTLAEVSMAANKHAERLGLSGWYLEFATEKETKKGTTALGFTTFLYPPDMDRPIPWDSYSGGESQRLQLAVSFGLGEVLLARAGISPNVEILDEPTDGLSAEGIKDLLDCLAERSQETGRTIWIIDHNSLDRGSFDGTILVEKTEDGSRIIK